MDWNEFILWIDGFTGTVYVNGKLWSEGGYREI